MIASFGHSGSWKIVPIGYVLLLIVAQIFFIEQPYIHVLNDLRYGTSDVIVINHGVAQTRYIDDQSFYFWFAQNPGEDSLIIDFAYYEDNLAAIDFVPRFWVICNSAGAWLKCLFCIGTFIAIFAKSQKLYFALLLLSICYVFLDILQIWQALQGVMYNYFLQSDSYLEKLIGGAKRLRSAQILGSNIAYPSVVIIGVVFSFAGFLINLYVIDAIASAWTLTMINKSVFAGLAAGSYEEWALQQAILEKEGIFGTKYFKTLFSVQRRHMQKKAHVLNAEQAHQMNYMTEQKREKNQKLVEAMRKEQLDYTRL